MAKLNQMLKSPRVLAGLAVAVAAVAGGAMWLGREKPPEYQTAEVRRGDLEVAISASGKVQPKLYVDVGAQVSGQLKKFLVEVGEHVEKGQLLAEIDETLAAAKVEADRAQLRELEASLSQQQATLELSRANAARADMLYKADAISQAEHQAATADRKIAEARLEQLKAQIERQNSTLEADLASLSYTKIYAPMSGTVVSQSAVEGQTLNANQTTPTILRIADLSVMTVEADVSEADVLRVKAGQEAYFTTLGSSTQRWTTAVRQVLPQPEVLNDVVLYKVLLDIDNPEELLKPEMTAQVFFVTGRAEDAVLAPVAALVDRPDRGQRGEGRRERAAGARAEGGGPELMAARASEGRPEQGRGGEEFAARREAMRAAREAHPDAQVKMVRVLTGKTVAPRPVLVGLSTRADAEILYGLEPGETVVTGFATPPPARRSDQRPRGPGGGGFVRRIG
ncbi:MAG: efflux RND transporter periplasmic adaptor subunit [Pseudomonadota bacterium]|nr:efflux RND transporter periplasmic adaptor subunit [Pseudomonadota bacterium]